MDDNALEYDHEEVIKKRADQRSWAQLVHT